MRSLFFLLFILITACGSPLDTGYPNSASATNATVATKNSASKPSPGWFKIVVLDVGQGDAALLIAPDKTTVLIDTGPPDTGPGPVLNVMKEMVLKSIDTIFISHNHADHIGGLKKIMESPEGHSAHLIYRTDAIIGNALYFDNVKIDIEGTNGRIGSKTLLSPKFGTDENSLSIALLVTYGEFSYFTAGDLTGGGGDPPYETLDMETTLAPLIGDIDVMHVSHHGSHTSSNQTLLDTLKPEVAILSLGDKNEFFHPHPSVIKRLQKIGAEIYSTEQGSLKADSDVNVLHDHICIVSDGKTYLVKPYTVDKCADPS
ncbi:MAG: MBL fold metallo-hydrolase [Deltaproteobacteria bacterium]|nr:MBL fold metallo-hydrolase [Deltaproteobacteria bacterium]